MNDLNLLSADIGNAYLNAKCSLLFFTLMNILQATYRLRDVGIPTKFLGSNIRQWKYTDDEGITQKCWALGSETYVKEACKVAEGQMKTHYSNILVPGTMEQIPPSRPPPISQS